MGKILCFIYNEMAEFEVTFAFHRLKNNGNKEIVSVAYDKLPVKSQSGFTFIPDATLIEAMEYEDVEALIIPGGPISEQKSELTDLIRKTYTEGKLVAAICNGPQFLGRAGILDNHLFTTSCSAANIKALGVEDPFPRRNFIEKRVVRDKNVITATGRAFVDFSFEVFEWLDIYANHKEEQAQLHRDVKGYNLL